MTNDTNPDLCPTCGRRITDYDMTGCETPSGQRWCMEHLPPDQTPPALAAWARFNTHPQHDGRA